MTIRVGIADDQAMIRSGLRLILESESDLDVVGEAADGSEAIAMVRSADPDVVLMDIRMPEMDGIEATGIICSGDFQARIVMLTTFDLDEYIYDALRAGASGFLLKDAPPDDLIRAVRVVAAGEALLAPSVTKRLLEEFAAAAPRPATDPPSGLTEREVEVLRAMADGLSNAEIADALFVSEATVKTHVSHILTKLELRDRVQAVVFAYESGLVLPRS